MNEHFARLYGRICQNSGFPAGVFSDLKQIGDFSNDLLAAIEDQAAAENWGCVCRLVWIVQRFPHSKFVPILCDLLDRQMDDVYMEAIVDALTVMRAEESVGALTRALNYRMEGDDLAFHFNRKVINALARVGSQKSIDGIKSALQSPEERIREAAEQELARLPQPLR